MDSKASNNNINEDRFVKAGNARPGEVYKGHWGMERK